MFYSLQNELTFQQRLQKTIDSMSELNREVNPILGFKINNRFSCLPSALAGVDVGLNDITLVPKMQNRKVESRVNGYQSGSVFSYSIIARQ